jgi:hypothetical protein
MLYGRLGVRKNAAYIDCKLYVSAEQDIDASHCKKKLDLIRTPPYTCVQDRVYFRLCVHNN